MKQSLFQFGAPTRKSGTNAARADGYDRANLECAHEILRDVDRYGGPDAFPAIWGRLVIERLERKAAA